MQTQHELEPMLDTTNQRQINNGNEIPPEAMEHLRTIRRMRYLVFLSAIVRVILNAVLFEPISFAISVVISVTGIIAGFKKHPALLCAYGLISIIQAIGASIFFVIILSNGADFPTWTVVFFFVTATIVAIGGIKAVKMKYKIHEYEQLYGPIPRCLGRVCHMAARPVAVETPQEETTNTDFVMIPMTQQGQQPVTQQNHPVVLNQQPMIYQQMPQQPFLVAQPQSFGQVQPQSFGQVQPQSFGQVQQGQQPIPVVYAFPPQNGNMSMYPQVQYVPQPAFIQQPIFAQPNVVPQPNN